MNSPVVVDQRDIATADSHAMPCRKSIPNWAQSFVETTVEANPGQVIVYDAFVVRDGKAAHHFAGVE